MEILLNILFIVLILTLIIISVCTIVYVINYLKFLYIPQDNVPTLYYLKSLDGDNIINLEDIEQITKRYNNNTKEYEITIYLKSNNTFVESFVNSTSCNMRFDDIYRMINDLDY